MYSFDFGYECPNYGYSDEEERDEESTTLEEMREEAEGY